VKGYNARFALKKLSRKDFDVIDAFQKTVSWHSRQKEMMQC
jgi:hypothetical protein